MARLGRRTFVKTSAVAAGGTAVFSGLFSRSASANAYGDLVPDPDGVLDLPEGFSYTILETAGSDMDDGYVVPARPDGMACFQGDDGNWIVMRNHEVSAGAAADGAYGAGEAPPEAYDDNAYGGVTRLVVDPATGDRISSNLVLTGTIRNCAGGPSPWGWLTCEEDTSTNHGFVFAAPIDAQSVVQATPIEGFGRFNHEAAAVDPESLYTYLTEDRIDGCFYRFVPDTKDDPFTGQLQALAIVGDPEADVRFSGTVGETWSVEWVDVDEPNPANDVVRMEARAAGAALFTRGEGLWYAEGALYFSCTNGGPAGIGQIFRLVDTAEGGMLELVAVSESTAVLDFPDNIAMAPWGELFIAEDGGGDQYIRILTPDGEICDFARNAGSDSELAGVCFSPDGTAMFFNIQVDGLTVMVTGPFPGDPSGGSSSGGDESSSGDVDPTEDSSTSGGMPTTDSNTDGGSASMTTAASAGSSGGMTDGSSGGDGSGQTDGDGCGCSTDGRDDVRTGLAVAGAAVLGWVAKGEGPASIDDDPTSWRPASG